MTGAWSFWPNCPVGDSHTNPSSSPCHPSTPVVMRAKLVVMVRAGCLALFLAHSPVAAQEPAAWGVSSRDPLEFHTFSIAAIDPRTGEVGVAVTTRVPCVGNGVPWVRSGVGAVATQANTRTEYGQILLDALAKGDEPAKALTRALAADSLAASRQVGVIAISGKSAQHTGANDSPWAGGRAGTNYVTQGNLLVGPEVVDAVAASFEASEGAPRHLADRLIDAIAAGYAKGGERTLPVRRAASHVLPREKCHLSPVQGAEAGRRAAVGARPGLQQRQRGAGARGCRRHDSIHAGRRGWSTRCCRSGEPVRSPSS